MHNEQGVSATGNGRTAGRTSITIVAKAGGNVGDGDCVAGVINAITSDAKRGTYKVRVKLGLPGSADEGLPPGASFELTDPHGCPVAWATYNGHGEAAWFTDPLNFTIRPGKTPFATDDGFDLMVNMPLNS